MTTIVSNTWLTISDGTSFDAVWKSQRDNKIHYTIIMRTSTGMPHLIGAIVAGLQTKINLQGNDHDS